MHSHNESNEWIKSCISRWSKNKNLDLKKIKKAVKLAKKKHAPANRKSGEPYINHPVRVADRVAEIFPDTLAIIGALLHDVIEDTSYKKEEMVEAFGEEISDIVWALTKVKKDDDMDNKNMTFEKILKYGEKDIRAILIKLIDRLDNLRDINVFKRNKQVRIANDSIRFYAELARVLGISEVENQIRDTCFKIRSPKRYTYLVGRIREITENSRISISQIIKYIKGVVDPNILSEVKAVEIKPHEFMLQKKLEFDLPTKISVIVKKPEDCYTAMGQLHISFKCVPLSIRDYISNPKSTGWHALISEVFIDRKKVSIYFFSLEHIKCNRFGVLYTIGEHNYQKTFYQKFIRFCLEIVKQQIQQKKDTVAHNLPFENSDSNFKEMRFEDLFKYINTSEIHTTTPKGKVIKTADNATILDFAYAVSPKLGFCCYGGEINGVLYPPETVLLEGNTINIITKNTITPNKKWLSIAMSPKAKIEISDYLKGKLKYAPH